MDQVRLYSKYEIEHYFESLPDDSHMEFQNDFFKRFMFRRMKLRDCKPKDIIEGYGTWWRMWTGVPTKEQKASVPFDRNIPVNDLFYKMTEERLLEE